MGGALKTTWRKGIESGEVNVVVQNMPKKHPELPSVPLLGDYVKTDEARKLIKYCIQDTAVITRPYFLSQAHRRIVSNYSARPLPIY